MPYFLHLKESEPESGTAYPTASDARQFHDPHSQKITFVSSDLDRVVWHAREKERFTDGKYFPVPWSDHDRCYEHFAHLSIETAGLVAYTKTDEHGVSDRQTRVKPGKYLQEFYSDIDRQTIAEWIAQCTAQYTQLAIARSTADIVAVYVNGPRSCMAGDDGFESDAHPCSAYGESDLGVAYTGPIDKVSGRCIVWPEKMLHSNIYGDEYVLQSLLKAAGFTRGSMRGARIRLIRCDSGYVVPYVDGCTHGSADGKWIVIGSGDINLHNTDGVSPDEEMERCANCNEQYDGDNYSTPYCQSCYDDSYHCEHCEETYFDDESTPTNDGSLCRHCARELTVECAIEDCSNDWIESALTSRQQRDRRNNGTTHLCTDCQDEYTFCHECDAWCLHADHMQCPDCHETPTDDETDDLPLDVPAPVVPPFLYMRHVGTEFVGEVSYLKFHVETETLWQVDKDGTFKRNTNNWRTDWRQHIASGAWEYFIPADCQMPRTENTPVLSHLTNSDVVQVSL